MIATDVIGTLYTPGTYDADGSVIDAPVALAGYHVNTSHPVADWSAFKVTPSSPRRVFGGGVTHYYTFADAAEFEAALDAADLAIPVPIHVPQSVTMRQARLALLGAGLLSGVAAAINAMSEPAKSAATVEWEYSGEVWRSKPFVQSLAGALGLSDAQLDALFITAATL